MVAVSKLTHVDEQGKVHMVDVGHKPDSERTAVARGEVLMEPETLTLINEGAMKKGDVALMNMNLLHRSGTNEGEHIRYTALCRYHRIMADDYVPFGLLYQFNEFLADRRRTSGREN